MLIRREIKKASLAARAIGDCVETVRGIIEGFPTP